MGAHAREVIDTEAGVNDRRPLCRSTGKPMAKHRVRRWFQFGVLDLLILITVVAVVAVLYRPVRIEAYIQPLTPGTKPGQRWSGNGLGMKFRWCPPGDFTMGMSPYRVDVKVTHGFWMGKYEVTQDEYSLVVNGSPSHFRAEEKRKGASAVGLDTARLPVENVEWDEA